MLPAHHNANRRRYRSVRGEVNQSGDKLRIPVARDLNEYTALIGHADRVPVGPAFDLRPSTHIDQTRGYLGVIREMVASDDLTVPLAGISVSDRGTL